ncbi:restriction endonuclease subunit S [Pseudoalteromonas sp. S558]|uniref:restriction endonuclease subunit S n=1 Tax=Pseudoalteromonas sp. S558 TaxID=2066515 RepID=UPI00110A7DF4|nr:restriction endonuclease subunit S [Pseudoalteromonas sp. S558]TMO02091.1 restriction endonuclease subunit S [Pseudoalteromonas sp. S558]
MSFFGNQSNWQLRSLKEIATLKRGYDLPTKLRTAGNVPIYAANGQNGSHNEAKIKGPGVITGRSGTIGKVHYTSTDYWPLNTSLYVTNFHGNDPKWVFYMLKAFQLERFVEGAGVPTLNRNLVHDELIPLPPLDEQKRIAAILDKADATRRKRQQAIQLADDFLRSVFLDMFGDPVTNPKGWEVKKFGEVGTLDRGKSKHRPRNDPKLLGGEHPLIQTGDVAKSGGYITSYSATYSDFGLAQSKKWKAGTLCITIAANIAKTGILTFEACFPDSVVGFKPNQLVTTEYVQTWLSFLQKILEANAPESAQKNINLAILRDLDIPLPPIEQQIRFTNTVEKINELKRKLNNSSKLNKDGFNSLSQKAFAGQL